MQESWKEMRGRADMAESRPIKPAAAAKSYSKTSGSGSLAVAAKGKKLDGGRDEADILDTGFTIREFSALSIKFWLMFQVFSLLFQLRLWHEVGSHLSEYEETVAQYCSSEHLQHGICHGPMWNLAAYQDLVLNAAFWADRHSFQFSTLSSPPTFLVAVNPVSRAESEGQEPAPVGDSLPSDDAISKDARESRWSLEVVRVQPPHSGMPFQRYHSGQQAVTFEDFSIESKEALAKNGRVEWRATLTARSHHHRKTRFLVFAEDAAMSHLEDIHKSPQCAFGSSWKAFNEHRQGRNHQALSWCNYLLGIFLLVGAGAIWLVQREAKTPWLTGDGRSFHIVVALKFVLQDMPQQVCIVLYVFGWYEASGLRCQLCMFRPDYCGAEQPFHFANFVAFSCCLLSSMANQLLIRPAFKKTYTEDDICMQYCVRIAGGCISVLPFTTGLCVASRSVLPMPTLFHILCAIPCGLGWLCLAGVICLPLLICCDDDM
eukprot:TRINITY_DN72344_c0_g1_i1.p1 TRINITY_DN72344_c0_g1~~TRINITY_DN72344_c0_g1_i1.p1  ORF type:complete len:488 (+),score=74.20 TRINITY_DN72344_c0_g1_i1:157-1620(+)